MERVVVTGLGLVLPNGIGVQEPWKHLLSGESAIGKITRFDATDFAAQVAGEVKGFALEKFWDDKRKVRELDRFERRGARALNRRQRALNRRRRRVEQELGGVGRSLERRADGLRSDVKGVTDQVRQLV